ncbi:DUF3267 domain-containing protein [Ornithinibacillus gellani]|uniref:DUF3267 domain-containing protein n=1 Tax=Ornithinibacillus gellani TaxID=2293253 RepID=UPI000F4ABE3C|nr:DUF3267 domain-containing protein [Ornithinibacillus gellani]TQS76602.1 DUF3267 domain-containing protein [Ornithinibacillus gellani]
MNCWKSYNLNKEFGINRIIIMSAFVALASFILLYVPISTFHGTQNAKDTGIYFFIIAIIFLFPMHTFMHMLPLIILKKSVKPAILNHSKLPLFTYYANEPLAKNISLFVTLAPTICITLPLLAASIILADYYVYVLLIAALHIGITYTDFLYVAQIYKAPKQAYVENDVDGFDILIKNAD